MMLALIAALAFGQQGSGPNNGSVITRGNFLRIPSYRTSGKEAQTYYVATTGDDSNNCTSVGSECRTVQGALNKVPKLLRDGTTVNVAAGTYGGFTISGFTYDSSIQQTSGGLTISGALATSTLATGSATGTAAGAGQSAGTQQPDPVFGTLCDSDASWTVNDLRGRFITTASPTNSAFVVSSNTATCITIVGTWALPVSEQTTYTIQDPAVIINTAVALPPNSISGASANRAAIEINDNIVAYRTSGITIKNMRLANPSGRGIEVSDNATYRFWNLQIRPSAASTEAFTVGQQGVVQPRLDIFQCDVSTASSAQMTTVSGGTLASTSTLWRNSGSALSGIVLGEQSPTTNITFDRSELLSLGRGTGCALCVSSSAGRTGQISGTRVSCASSPSTAVFAGALVANAPAVNKTGSPVAGPYISGLNVQTCGTGITAVGPTSLDVLFVSGAAATTGLSALLGAVISFNWSGTSLTAGTNQVNLDSGGLTATYDDVLAAGTIGLGTAPHGSRVYAR